MESRTRFVLARMCINIAPTNLNFKLIFISYSLGKYEQIIEFENTPSTCNYYQKFVFIFQRIIPKNRQRLLLMDPTEI